MMADVLIAFQSWMPWSWIGMVAALVLLPVIIRKVKG